MDNLYDIEATAIDGSRRSIGDYRGKVLLVVNVASRCVHTPQYAGLETLYRKHKDRGLVILGFPAISFAQEPVPRRDFGILLDNYAITFPMLPDQS